MMYFHPLASMQLYRKLGKEAKEARLRAFFALQLPLPLPGSENLAYAPQHTRAMGRQHRFIAASFPGPAEQIIPLAVFIDRLMEANTADMEKGPGPSVIPGQSPTG